MSFDANAEFLKYKDAYARLRGYSTGTGLKTTTGQKLIADSKGFPLTTWGDVYVFYETFMKATDPLGKYSGSSSRIDRGDGFIHTESFRVARENWWKTSPIYQADLRYGSGKGVAYLPALATQRYPYNEAFWGYGARYAIARSAAGEVPSSFSLAVDSVKESSKDLWGAASGLIPKLPNLYPIATIVKWSVIGTGLFLVWKYVLPWVPKKES